MVKINKDSSFRTKFNFEKFINLIISVLPKQDVIRIDQINFVDDFGKKSGISKSALALYKHGRDGKNSSIEINIRNLHKDLIQDYLFDSFPEIATLLLSEVVCHEIGHHVHHSRRHGIKKTKAENFADKYSVAGYYHYLIFRHDKIMSSFKWDSRNILLFNKKQRHSFIVSKDNIRNWLDENRDGLKFP